jgi:Flp pilus assembly protein TadG
MIRKISARRSDEGSVAVEAAITLSVLLFLLLGSVQFGLAYFAWNTMLLAAEEAGRYAMLYNPVNYPSGPPAQTCSATPATLANCAVAWANQNWGNDFPVTAGTNASCPSGMTFTATYTINLITPISLTRYVCVPLI